MDTTQGHGDVLVGFAAHVEQVGPLRCHLFEGLSEGPDCCETW